MNLRVLCVALAGAITAACATTPPPAATLTYAGQNCAAQPNLAAAQSLTPERERASHAVNTPINTLSPCLTTAEGAASPYVVYALPADTDDKTFAVGAPLEIARIFAPRVEVLDAQGVVVRSFARDQYMYRGNAYSVVFRPRAGERYVMVTADPQLVGQRYDSINISTSTTGTAAGGVYVSWTSGVDAAQSRAFSYEGAVSVTISDSDTDG